jgi:hypothetical protein
MHLPGICLANAFLFPIIPAAKIAIEMQQSTDFGSQSGLMISTLSTARGASAARGRCATAVTAAEVMGREHHLIF